MERWDFLFSVMSSPILYFLTTLLAVCPNINPTILCAHVCDVTMRRAIAKKTAGCEDGPVKGYKKSLLGL